VRASISDKEDCQLCRSWKGWFVYLISACNHCDSERRTMVSK